MTKGTFLSSTWAIGLLVAIAVTTAGALAAYNGGVSIKAGGIEVNLDLTPQAGVDLQFVSAR